ncbi:hypothetical protein B4U80_13025, partial [Leptotrombidium deliense]
NGSTSSDVNDKHNSKPANILHNVDEMCKQTSIREKNTMWFLNNLSKYLNGMRKESQSGIGNVTKNRVNLRESEINKCSSSEKGNKQTSLRVTPETVVQQNNSISLQIAKQQKNEPANHANVPISIKKEKSAKESKILHNALTHVSSLAVEKSVIKHGCNSRTVIKVDSNYSFVTCEKSDDFKKIEIPLQKRKKRGVYNLDVVNSCIFIKVKDKFKLFACKICSREFTRIDWVRRHVATVHKKLRPFVCKTCGRRLTTSQSLSEHMMSLHNNNKRNYRCNVCGKRYKTRNHLYYHRTRVHEFSHACTCDVCGASYKSRPVMRRHFEKYHPNAVFNEAKVLNSITDVAPANVNGFPLKMSAFNVSNFAANLIKDLYLDSELADVYFVCGKELVPGHKVIVAKSSDYFKNLLYKDEKNKNSREIEIFSSAVVFKVVLQFIYTGIVEIDTFTDLQVIELHSICRMITIQPILDIVVQKLNSAEFNFENIAKYFEPVKNTPSLEYVNKFWSFVDSNAERIVKDKKVFNTFSYEFIQEIIQRDTFEVTEIVLFKAINNWHKERNVDNMNDIWKYLRLNLINEIDYDTFVYPEQIFTDREYILSFRKARRLRIHEPVVQHDEKVTRRDSVKTFCRAKSRSECDTNDMLTEGDQVNLIKLAILSCRQMNNSSVASVEILITLITGRIKKEVCDELLHNIWILIRILTNNKENCIEFVKSNGINLISQCIEMFANDQNLLTEILFVMNNIAKHSFQQQLMVPVIVEKCELLLFSAEVNETQKTLGAMILNSLMALDLQVWDKHVPNVNRDKVWQQLILWNIASG